MQYFNRVHLWLDSNEVNNVLVVDLLHHFKLSLPHLQLLVHRLRLERFHSARRSFALQHTISIDGVVSLRYNNTISIDGVVPLRYNTPLALTVLHPCATTHR